jgi:fatty-acyl-CoA synthase
MVELPDPPPQPMRAPFSRTLSDLLFEQAQRRPQHAAVIARGHTHTYAALAGRVRVLAGALHARGVRRGTRVATLIDNRIELLEAMFAAACLGAAVVPLSTWSTRAELDFLLRDARVHTLFMLAQLGERDFAGYLRALRKTLPRLAQVVVVDGAPGGDEVAYEPLFDAATDLAWDPALAPGDAASAGDTLVVLYTSGSSNRPKAVPLLHRAAIENGFNIGERQGLGPEDRVFVPIPLFWSYGAVNALPAALSHGATLVIQQRFEPEAALELIQTHRCTAIYTLPAITNALLGAPGFNPASTRTLRTGLTIGTAQDVMRAANELGAAQICNIYGSTETYGNCCVTPHHWALDRRARCQGPPLPGVTIRVRDPVSGEPCPAGQVGAVEVRGYLTPGYDGDSARFNSQVFSADGWFRTGDLAALDADGCLVYAGRRSEMIKRSGINVSPAEIEEVLQRHPGVGLAGVTGTPDAARDEAIVAFIVCRAGAVLTREALLAHCRAHLSRYKLPDRIEFRDALPLTATGKLLRKELKALALGLAADGGTH